VEIAKSASYLPVVPSTVEALGSKADSGMAFEEDENGNKILCTEPPAVYKL
jgi:hypothetical protein